MKPEQTREQRIAATHAHLGCYHCREGFKRDESLKFHLDGLGRPFVRCLQDDTTTAILEALAEAAALQDSTPVAAPAPNAPVIECDNCHRGISAGGHCIFGCGKRGSMVARRDSATAAPATQATKCKCGIVEATGDNSLVSFWCDGVLHTQETCGQAAAPLAPEPPQPPRPDERTKICSGCGQACRCRVSNLGIVRVAAPCPARQQEAPAHTESSDCWCRPRLNYCDPVTGTEHWVHRSDDELERN
jgi:hypothetical protein